MEAEPPGNIPRRSLVTREAAAERGAPRRMPCCIHSIIKALAVFP